MYHGLENKTINAEVGREYILNATITTNDGVRITGQKVILIEILPTLETHDLYINCGDGSKFNVKTLIV